ARGGEALARHARAARRGRPVDEGDVVPIPALPSRRAARRARAVNVRSEFPVLAQSVHGKPLVYLDSAATSQKPRAVIDAVSRFYAEDNANVHRGVHSLAERATARLESARARVQKFLNAARSDEIVFVRG